MKQSTTGMQTSLSRVHDAEYLQVRAERLRWIINVRWVAMAGMGLSGAALQWSGYALQGLTPGWYLVIPAVLINLLFIVVLNLSLRGDPPPEKLEFRLRWQAYAQSTADAVLLTTLVYLNGGPEFPLYTIPLFAVFADAVLLSGFEIFVQANLAWFLLGFFFLGEYTGRLPSIPYLSPGYSQNLAKDWPAMWGELLAMGVLLNVAGFISLTVVGRMDRLEIRTRRMLARMREQVLRASADLAESSAGLSHGAADVNLVAGQMAATVQQIALGAAHQAGQLENISHNLEGLADASRSMARGAQETHQAAAETVSLGERGRQAARNATARMNEIAQLFAQTEQALQSLAQRSKEIGEIASAIDRFAERTDLLALNAGIEAARAGEHGRGFAVVAGEVKKLATSSSNSATRVAEMIQQIQDSLQAASKLMRSGNLGLADGLQTLAVVQKAVDEMSAVITHTEALSKGMEGLSQQQLDAHQRIVHAIGEVASAAEQTAAGAEEAAAAVEEQAATMSDFSQAVEQLADLAEQLKSDVAGLTGEQTAAPVPAAEAQPEGADNEAAV